MKTLSLSTLSEVQRNHKLDLSPAPSKGIYILFGLLLLLWLKGNLWLQNDPTAAPIDSQNLYLLIILSMICFLGILGLCWWLFQTFWSSFGLPPFNSLVLHFKTLELWQQLGFAWAYFALLLLAAIGCLMAIC
jgi:hypothetical protein